MSGRRLIPLAALLIVLIVAAVILKRQSAPSKLSDEAGFQRVLPQTLRADRITGLDLYQGATPEKVVQLRRQANTWVIASHYNAPVQADKLASFLDMFSVLEGELRSDRAELLQDFRLESPQALHLQVYLDNSETPEVHLLAGKSRGPHGFVRLANDNRVYSVNLNLYHEAGLYDNHTEQSPQAKPWIDLQIQNLPKPPFSEIALHTPGQRWRFVRQQPNTSSPDTPPETSKTERPWILVEPDVAYTVKQSRLHRLVTALRTLRAEDIAEPANSATYGLEDALYRVILTVPSEAQATHNVTLSVGREVPDQAGKRYARVGTEGPIYILPPWTFERLFPKGKDLLDLPGFAFQEADIQQIALISPTRMVQFTRSTGETSANPDGKKTSGWLLTYPPDTTFMVQQDSVEALVHQLANFTPDDVAPLLNPVPAMSPNSLPGLEITLQDASHHLLRFGPPLAAHPNQYVVYLSSQDTPFMIDEKTRDNLFPSLRTLLDVQPLRSPSQEITRLTWHLDKGTWTLERLSSGLSMTVPSQETAPWRFVESPEVTVNMPALNTLLTSLAQLTAGDWLEHFMPQTDPAQAVLTFAFTLADGRTEHMALSRRHNEHYLRVTGTPGWFVIPATTYKTLVEAFSFLSPTEVSSATAKPQAR
jgi:hypothetical protein